MGEGDCGFQLECERRLLRLEEGARQQGADLEEYGGTLDHLTNTMDTIVIPQLAAHTARLVDHESVTKEAHDYIVSQRGAWQFIQRIGIVIAALASVVTLVMKIKNG